jgi:hypothetical protein
VGVDSAEHLAPLRQCRRLSRLGATVHLVVIIDQMTARMSGDDDPVVGDVQQSISGFDRDGFPGEMATDVIAVLEDADASGARGTSFARTQKREWSSIPVTTDSWIPLVRWTPPMTSICHSSIERDRSQRL